MKQDRISLKDFGLVLIVVILWGLNFIAMKIGLSGFPPFFLVAMRFGFVFFPACLWIKRPKVPLKYLFWYSFFLGVGQYSFMFTALMMGMPAGIASVLLQSQVIFSLILAALLLEEKITSIQVLGIMISVFGVLFLGGVFDQDTTLPFVPFILMILAAISFGTSNVRYRMIVDYNNKRGETTNSLQILVWSSLFVPIPMFIISFVLETPQVVFLAIRQLQAPALLSLLYMVVLSTLIAYGLWGSLIGKYSSSKIAPFSLLVPLVGVLSGYLVLGESMTQRQIIGIVITVSGLVFTNLGTMIIKKIAFRQRKL